MSDCRDRLPARKIPSQNLAHRLRRRQIERSHPAAHFHVARLFHECIFPNFTVVNIQKPASFLRKFSPDGRHFVCFSVDQSSLEIYEYRGPAAGVHLLHSLGSDSAELKQNLFARMFRLKSVCHVTREREHLNRECSLFTCDGHFVIVASSAPVRENPYPFFYDLFRNNESLPHTTRSQLEDYTLHIIDLHTGELTDSRQFKCDKIFLSHNQGLYLYINTLVVLSIQQQTVHVFKIMHGQFVDIRTIGRFCHEDDELIWSLAPHQQSQSTTVAYQPDAEPQPYRPYHETTINTLKHRLLAFLWRSMVLTEEEGVARATAARLFFKQFEYFRQLCMWKMQLLDDKHLLIRYASEEVVLMKAVDANSHPSLFVVYNIESTEIVAVYENTSQQMYDLFEKFADHFRNAIPPTRPQFTCSSSSNLYALNSQCRFKLTITNAKYGGPREAIKRLLAQLPISAQSYSASPYLDLSLFSYDEKCVSVLERPKACGDAPVRSAGCCL